jgi:hypothetical protein
MYRITRTVYGICGHVSAVFVAGVYVFGVDEAESVACGVDNFEKVRGR